jgi:prolyl oligopeptidase
MAETPPIAPLRPVVDLYHGQAITDPYRHLEDFKNPDVQKWVKSQADFADRTLRSLPGREALLQRIQELDAGRPFSVSGVTRLPFGSHFYFKQLANENVAKIYFRKELSGPEELLIDPEQIPKTDPADHFTISFFRVSPDGSKVLYGYAASGSEQTTLKVLDVASRKHLPESMDRIEAEYALPYWLPDGTGFVYSRRRALPANASVTDAYGFTQAFLHVLGTPPEKDRIVFADGAPASPPMEKMDFPAVIIPTLSKWIIGQVKHGDETDISLYVAPLADLDKPSLQWHPLCNRHDLVNQFEVRGDEIYLLTAKDAPRYKVVRTSLSAPNLQTAETIVPTGDNVVHGMSVAKDALYVEILAGVPSKILRITFADMKNTEIIELPAVEPAAMIVTAHAEIDGVYIATRSWSQAGHVYEYDPTAKSLTDTRLLAVGKYDLPANLTSTEFMVSSHDGVKVPLSIIHRKDIQLNGSNPTILSGYGAYGATAAMRYEPTELAWLERGGVLAVAHVRGGGAYGKEWHHAGRKLTKPNTWKDFIACAEYLIRTGYTSPAKLAGRGGSAGGILIGRAITERPDLFAAAQIAVGCTDMLRFETTMNGPPNVPEFGALANPDEFRGLLAMSTLHHIRDGIDYPAVLLTHGINDPRVEPWQSAKATARFQAASKSNRPVLFRVDYHSGHGIGSTRKQRQEEQADVWSFFLQQFGDKEFQPK